MAEEKFEIKKIRKRNGKVAGFDKEKITEAIWKAAQAVGGKDRKTAERLSRKVVTVLEYQFGEKEVPTVEEVQDIVERVLIKSGHAKTAKEYILYRHHKAKIRETKKVMVDAINTISEYLDQSDWRVKENSNEAYSFSGLLLHTAGKVMSNYNLTKMYDGKAAEAHRKGYAHIHDLSHGVIGYSFYRNEAVVVRHRESKGLLSLSMEQLFDLVQSPVEKENGFEIKYTDDFEVLDEDGWTPIERVLRHKADKPLVSFNTFSGHNLIVTSDHPFITLEDVKDTLCPGCGSTELSKTRSARESRNGPIDYFRCKSCKETFNNPVLRPDTTRRAEKEAGDITVKNYALTPGFSIKEGSMNSLSPEDGWFIGLFLAEGYRKMNYLSFELNSSNIAFKKLLTYLESNSINYNMCQRSPRNLGGLEALEGHAIVDVHLGGLSQEVQHLFSSIRPYSENKNMPVEFLNYSPGFVGGIVSGLIDGDGTVINNDPWVSSASLRITSKTLLSQVQFWLESQGINSSLCSIDSFGERRKGNMTVRPSKQLYSLRIFIPEEKSRLFSECLKINGDFKFSKKNYQKKEYSNIRKIEHIKNDSDYVYDITTGSHTFLCNGTLAHNCAGWSLKNLLLRGFGGVANKVDCKPAKHMSTVVHQMVNYIGCLQMEFAGAQAFSSVDTLLAPFVRADGLSYKQVKQNMQQLVFSLNIPSRWGSQFPFSNLTFDWEVPGDMRDEPAIVGGKDMSYTYADLKPEIDMVNKAFMEVMWEGDAKGRIFSFPIPTYNVTKDFDFKSENAESLFKMTAKYGAPYFQNYAGSNLDPSSIRAMCCRLNLDQRELMKRPGSMWGPGDNTGSIGVFTVNMNRLGYEASNEDEFLEKVGHYMQIGKESLEVKRRVVEKNLRNQLMPFTKVYLGTFDNHFSTIGLLGMNEAMVNLTGENIASQNGKQITIKTLNFMREKLRDFQEETGNLYNLEATPAEGASYRMAREDKKMYGKKIYTAGTRKPYLTNSTQLPVGYTDDLVMALEHQNDIQPLYTGGTIFHTFLGESISDWNSAATLVKKIAFNSRLPYFSITPTFSVCPIHGFVRGEHSSCPVQTNGGN